MEHKHSFFIYNDGSGCAYCMGCDIVLNEADVQDVLNNHYNAPTPKTETCDCGEPYPKTGYCIFCGTHKYQKRIKNERD